MAAVAVELPTPKQAISDTYAWNLDAQVSATRTLMTTGETKPLAIAGPSRSTCVDQGFGSVAAFFPEGKRQSAALAEFIARGTGSNGALAQIFDDQFMSSGGQMIELLTGKDRFVIDVRPQLSAPDGGQSAHPYDLALAPLLQASGVVLRAPHGAVLDVAYGLDEPVGWCGYANAAIAHQVQPLVEQWLGFPRHSGTIIASASIAEDHDDPDDHRARPAHIGVTLAARVLPASQVNSQNEAPVGTQGSMPSATSSPSQPPPSVLS